MNKRPGLFDTWENALDQLATWTCMGLAAWVLLAAVAMLVQGRMVEATAYTVVALVVAWVVEL